MPGKRIKVQQEAKQEFGVSDIDQLMYLVCWYYPQYTFKQAKYEMPYRRVIGLLRTARQQEARNYLNLTNIAASPHTKGGKGVKKLQDQFKKEIKK